MIYLLDGDSLFPLLAPTHLFLTYDEKIPEAILVGIAYGGFDAAVNKRDVDFTAPSADSPVGWDGAPNFLQFLKDELLPTIETQYPVDKSRRVLLGQSRGGYFVLWSALQAPDLFWARIASNPTFAPGRQGFYGAPGEYKRQDLKLYLASGSRDTPIRQQEAAQWAQYWQQRTHAPWRIHYSLLQDTTHAASIGQIYRQAMLWLFAGEEAKH